MNAHSTIAPVVDWLEVYSRLPDREALQLLKMMAERFSGVGYGYDKVDHGIDLIAIDLAEDDGWRGDDLADRYLASPSRFGPGYLNLAGRLDEIANRRASR